MSRWISFIAVTLCFTLSGAGAGGGVAAAERPNLLVVVTDDQGRWAVGAYGNKEVHTPHMDSLARDGVAPALSLRVEAGRSRLELALPGAAPADAEVGDPNLVKVVLGRDCRALYFSRSPIPHDRDGTGIAKPLLHVGLYAYRRDH